jgi:hypothetical protein
LRENAIVLVDIREWSIISSTSRCESTEDSPSTETTHCKPQYPELLADRQGLRKLTRLDTKNSISGPPIDLDNFGIDLLVHPFEVNLARMDERGATRACVVVDNEIESRSSSIVAAHFERRAVSFNVVRDNERP